VHLDFELLSGLVTLLWFVSFIGLWVWAWSRRRRPVYDAAARMPLEQDGSG
jgi:cytochrome c oxidase cbb3-type subunit 4